MLYTKNYIYCDLIVITHAYFYSIFFMNNYNIIVMLFHGLLLLLHYMALCYPKFEMFMLWNLLMRNTEMFCADRKCPLFGDVCYLNVFIKRYFTVSVLNITTSRKIKIKIRTFWNQNITFKYHLKKLKLKSSLR